METGREIETVMEREIGREMETRDKDEDGDKEEIEIGRVMETIKKMDREEDG